jgi:hypothetical protein
MVLLKFVNTQTEDSFNLAYKIGHEKNNEKVRSNIYIVSCLIVAISYLALQKLLFRGHLENTELENRRNYI